MPIHKVRHVQILAEMNMAGESRIIYLRECDNNEYSIKYFLRPVAGSLTEARGQKANIHIIREMLQLCEVIDMGGYAYCPENPGLKVMLFGELFNVRCMMKRIYFNMLIKVIYDELDLRVHK